MDRPATEPTTVLSQWGACLYGLTAASELGKQSISDLVQHGEDLGWILLPAGQTRKIDPRDVTSSSDCETRSAGRTERVPQDG